MRESNSIPAHGMMASESSRESLEQLDLFSPPRDLFSLFSDEANYINGWPEVLVIGEDSNLQPVD